MTRRQVFVHINTHTASQYVHIYYYGCHRKYHIEYIAGAIFWSEKKFHVCYCCVIQYILCTTCRQVSLSLPNEYTSMSVSISSTIPVSTMGAAFHYRSSSCDFLSIMKQLSSPLMMSALCCVYTSQSSNKLGSKPQGLHSQTWNYISSSQRKKKEGKDPAGCYPITNLAPHFVIIRFPFRAQPQQRERKKRGDVCV